MKKDKKKICFVITAQNQYARSSLLLTELQKRKNIELSIVVAGSATLSHFGNVAIHMKGRNLVATEELQIVMEGGTPLAMARTTGLATMEFASAFSRLQPNVVVLRADRYEILGAATAAALLNIPVAHLEGGDVTGTIDESIRHAVTKLAHLHFVTNAQAYKRIERMGEPKKYIYNVGAPEVEYTAHVLAGKKVSLTHLNYEGVGAHIDFNKPYIVVMNHPVTTEYGSNKSNTQALLRAVDEEALQTIWFWPNIDAGTNEVSEAIRIFRELDDARAPIRFLKYVAPDEFLFLLQGASCLVGNSSAGIKEASYIGTPVVNIGTRQQGRTRGKNVLDINRYDTKLIKNAIEQQIGHGPYKQDGLYYKKGTSKRIVDVLEKETPPAQKQFND